MPLLSSTVEDRDLLAQVVAVSADAIFSEDLDGVVTSWNAAAERVYGVTAEAMLGRSAGDLLPEETATELVEGGGRALAGERVERFDSWHLRPDGRHIAVSVTMSPLRRGDGDVIGVATSVQDVTERVRLAAELEDLQRALATQKVRDGAAALDCLMRRGEHADAQRPDLVILDLNLPKMNGHEVLAAMREEPELRRIAVAVLTTSGAEADVVETYDLGANCYLTKPVDMEQFIRVVQAVDDFWLGMVRLPRS